MRRAARVEGLMVGAAIASSAPRRTVVVAPPVAPMTTMVVPPPTQTVVVDNYNPYPPPMGYQQPGAYPQPAYPQPGYPQPGYPQPGYPQPGYPQPGYPQPGISPPAYMAPPMPGYAPPPQEVIIAKEPIAPHPAAVIVAPTAPAAPVAPAVAAVPVAPAAVAAAVATETAIAAAVAERRHFYLINEATCTVLGVDKSCVKPNTHLVIDKRRPDKSYHQIWYMDKDDVLRSKLTDFAIESKGKDERVKLVPFVGDARQLWTLEGNRIVNKALRTNCLGLRKLLRLKDDADVIVQNYEGKPYQHWRMEPVVL